MPEVTSHFVQDSGPYACLTLSMCMWIMNLVIEGTLFLSTLPAPAALFILLLIQDLLF